ncbi:DUF4190 domain-containing protein [Sporolactobacillus terrae]|uniref:DUF4190 domain-containing protein n=1 Tax=Sporolactobacillus terrae TaxID=269673 RepID=A0A410DCW6_9BACL|nr:DUF4190 domain-containing protein [Sporolactobacillus terrae]QAA23861.1 DUF4190 domain-containing protein [Sporolactobacillus terrae]QAA26832.1 DUF4190 domain-containing protein [Sporolactobacillus terrae]UAK15894.1 DUF4190 domain-containing protein [Sporolactobacillus terrae]BBO00401.1 hypothetical protein St703_31050 [Sporolactobacillus terrae]
MEAQQNQVNGKSIAALVLGITAIIIPYVGLILGILGIIFSKKALNEIAQYGQQGRGMAIAGLVTSIISVSIYALIIFFIVIVAGVAANLG